jgi:hypothetical protein
VTERQLGREQRTHIVEREPPSHSQSKPSGSRWHRALWGKNKEPWVRRAQNSIMGHFG